MIWRKVWGICLLNWTLVAWGQVTLIVDQIPANTPAGDDIYVAGNFQGWAPDDTAYRLQPDTALGIFHITITPTPGPMAFKFTRGAWTKVESDANGNFIPDRTYTPTAGDTLRLQIAGWEDLNGGGGNPSTAAENVQLLSDSFFISTLNRYRRVWVYLPPDYDQTTYAYPVLYMHDGQNVFDRQTAFAGEWEVDETLNQLHAEGDSGIIVVAIANGEANRTAELTPWSHPTYGGGDGTLYLDFLVQELKPHIDSVFRTLPDREHTGIMGSSLGGLISTYAAISYSEVFGRIGAFSPAYWINPELYGHVSDVGKEASMRLYQVAGTPESITMVPNMLRMQDTLRAAGFEAEEVLSLAKADGQHSEWFWAREFAAAYLWLFRETTTSVETQALQIDGLRLFPNPTRDRFTLEIPMHEAGELHIEIVDTLGRINEEMYAGVLSAGSHQLTIDLQPLNLVPGTYFVKVSGGGAKGSISFVLEE